MGTVEDAIEAAELIDSRLDIAATVAKRAQEAGRELREALSDARQAQRDLEAVEARVAVLVKDAVGKLLEEAVSEQIYVLGEMTKEHMRKSVDKVQRSFDSLESALLGTERGDSRPSLMEYTRQVETALSLRWPAFMQAVRAAQATGSKCSKGKCTKDPKYAVLARMPLPSGGRGELHLHMCAEHRDSLKKEDAVTVIKSVNIADRMCPWEHDFRTNIELPEEA
jgi:hypothetical protein